MKNAFLAPSTSRVKEICDSHKLDDLISSNSRVSLISGTVTMKTIANG